MKIKNVFKHLSTIFRHKWHVFKLCFRAGLVWRGIVHDLSKFSLTEFWGSIKYYTGVKSPIVIEKAEKGHSVVWLHHFGRNKHHHEYWYDYDAPVKAPIMPYKYLVESVCDGIAAGITYRGKSWTSDYQLKYWENRQDKIKNKIHPQVNEFYLTIFKEVSEFGLKATINKKNLRVKYAKIVLGGSNER